MPLRKLPVALALLLALTAASVWAAPGAGKGQRKASPLPRFTTRQGRVFVLGAKPTPRAQIAKARHLVSHLGARATLPTSVDLTPKMPPIGDQGQQGSCTAWATGYYYKTFQETQEHGTNPALRANEVSPAWTYNQINYGQDEGSWIGDAMELFRTKGAVSLTEMPYSDQDYVTWPTLNQYLTAMPWRSQDYGYFFVNQGDGGAALQAMKEHLAGGDPIVLSFPVYTDFDPLPPDYLYDGPQEDATFRGNHAVCIVGYDDTVGGKGGFKILNSWGPGWADHGAFYMSYDFLANYAWEAWAMVDRVGYVPQNWARLRLQHTYRGDLQITMGNGTPATATWAEMVYDGQGGSSDDLNCYVDLTDAGGYLGDWWVQIRDLWSGDEGVLNEFTICRGTTGELSSNEASQIISDHSTIIAHVHWALEQVLLQAITDVGNPLSESNYVTASYQRLGVPATAQVWDGHSVAVEVDSGSRITFSGVSSGSSDTERWRGTDPEDVLVSPADTGGTPGEHHYVNQLHKLFNTHTNGLTALSADNPVTVTYVDLGASKTVSAWDSMDASAAVWTDRGSRYAYTARSTQSGSTERWAAPAPAGYVDNADPAVAEYWHQVWAEVTLSGTDSTYHVPLLAHTALGEALAAPERHKYGSWADWCDTGTQLTFANSTVGNPGKMTTDTVSWSVAEPLTATLHYATAYRIAGYVKTADGTPQEGVAITLTSAEAAAATATQQTATDATGRYEFSPLEAGSYTVQAAQAGLYFKPPTRSATCGADTGNPAPATMGFTALDVPRVVLYDPTGSGVALLPTVRLGFDLHMDQAVTQDALTLREGLAGGGWGEALPGTYKWTRTVIGDILAFVPQDRLHPNSLYQVSLSTKARSDVGARMDAPLEWTFQTTNGLGLTSYGPVGQSVALDTAIALEFDRDVVPASVEQYFGLAPAVEGTFQWQDARHVRFVPNAPLPLSTTYTVTLGALMQGADQSLLGQDFVWTFQTQGAARLVAKSPDANATDVALAAPVVLTFNQPMDTTTTPAAFSLTDTLSGQAVGGSCAWDLRHKVLTFRPSQRLTKQTVYQARLAATATGAHGAPLAGGAQSWTFTTADQLQITSFTPTGRVVPTASNLTLTFDRNVDKATFALTLSPSKAGTLVWSGNRQVTFYPETALTLDTLYTATVAGTTAGADGKLLGADFRWSFRTGSLTQVTASSPRGIGIRPVTPVRLTFDRAMNVAAVESLFSMWKQGTVPERVTGTFAWSNGNRLLVFTPDTRYASLTDYRVTLPRTATSAQGIALETGLDWIFQTGNFLEVSHATPVGTGEPTQAIVSVTFGLEVDRRSVERGFSLTPNVPGTFNWENAFTFHFIPNVLLTPGQRYDVALAAGVKARNGLTLGSAYTWNFTVDPLAPTALALTGVSAAGTGSGTVAIAYALSAPAGLTAEVLNLAGRPVALVQSSGVAPAGSGTLLWNGRSSLGTRVPAGTYLVRMTAHGAGGSQCTSLSSLAIR